jgi:hypothetical protein
MLRTEKIVPLMEKEVVVQARTVVNDYVSLAVRYARLGQTAAGTECLNAAAKISAAIRDDKSEAQALERFQREVNEASRK